MHAALCTLVDSTGAHGNSAQPAPQIAEEGIISFAMQRVPLSVIAYWLFCTQLSPPTGEEARWKISFHCFFSALNSMSDGAIRTEGNGPMNLRRQGRLTFSLASYVG